MRVAAAHQPPRLSKMEPIARPGRLTVVGVIAIVGGMPSRMTRDLVERTLHRDNVGRWLPIAVFAAVAIVLGIALGSPPGPVSGNDPSPTPSTAGPTRSRIERTWSEPAAYVYAFDSRCGERNLIGKFKVVVEGGVAISYQPLDERAASFPGGIDAIPTLGQLSARAEEASKDDKAVLTLETDPTDGHPSLINIDWLPNAIDDEECYQITHYASYPAAPDPSEGPVWTEPDSYVYVFDSQCGLR